MNIANNVRIIPAIRTDVEMVGDNVITKKRTAAYARVSTGREEQQTSFKSQMEYYTRLIMSNPDWEFVGIYADEGISARSMKKRKRFREMIDDALNGKIDQILVKSVSRFARNVLDSLTIIDKLRQKGIPVIFEKEKLNSLYDDKRTNFMLTMYASIAQEESDSLSDSVNWGIQRRNEQGFVRKVKTYGYDVLNKQYVVNEQQAGVVKLIFELYLSGLSYFQISKELKSRGIKSPKGLDRWDTSTIEQMLKNEKYVGDALLQKTIAQPWRNRKRSATADNQMYLVEDDHEALISDEMFERVKREMAYRKTLRANTKSGKGGYSSKYPFSSKIYCYGCGGIFRRHFYYADRDRTPEKIVYTWTCSTHKNHGNVACGQQAIKEKDIEASFIRVVNMLVKDKADMITKLRDTIQETIGERLAGAEAEDIRAQIEAKQKALVRAVRAMTTDDDQIAVSNERERIIGEIESLTAKLQSLENQATEMGHTTERLNMVCDLIAKQGELKEFDPMVFRKMVYRITVDGKELTYDFGNGIIITDMV